MKDDLINQFSGKQNELNDLDNRKFNEQLEQTERGFDMAAFMLTK